MGWLEITLLAVAAVILAANQLLRDAPNITVRFPTLRPRGWWNYLPLAFLVLAGVVYVARPLLPIGAPAGSVQASDVIKGIPVETLTGFHEGHTQLEADRLIAPYLGTEVEVRGTVERADRADRGRTVIWLAERPIRTVMVAVYLDESQRAYAERLRVGDPLRARCRLRIVLQGSIALEACVIPGAPPPEPYQP